MLARRRRGYPRRHAPERLQTARGSSAGWPQNQPPRRQQAALSMCPPLRSLEFLALWLLRQSSIANGPEVPTEIVCAAERPIATVFDIRNADTRSFPQSLHTRPDVLLLILDQAQTLPHHFAGILITPLSHEPLDKLSLVICEYHVPRRHGCHLAITLIGILCHSPDHSILRPAIHFIEREHRAGISVYQAFSPQRTIFVTWFGGNLRKSRRKPR